MGCSEVKVTDAQFCWCGTAVGTTWVVSKPWGLNPSEAVLQPRKKSHSEVAVRIRCGSRPVCNTGKADFLWEETGIGTIGSHWGKGPGTWGKTCGDNVGKGHLPAGTGDNLQRPAA